MQSKMNIQKNISKIILGTAQMGLDYGVNNRNGMINPSDSFKILELAFLKGIEYLDCAESYGDIHKTIGMFKTLHPKKEFKINTKLSSFNTKKNSFFKIDKFLSDLKIKQINSLMFHSYSMYKKNIDHLRDYKSMKEDGIINNIGVSVYTNQEIKKLINDDNIDLIQIPFNLLDSSREKLDLIKEAKTCGKIIQARSIFLQGLFFKNPEDNDTILKELNNEILAIKAISDRYKIPLNEMALNYVLSYDCIDYVVLGVDNLIHLKKNIMALDKSLDKKIIDEINLINTKHKTLLNPSNW